MPIGLIYDDENGLSCRNKLNAAIGVINSLPPAQQLPSNIKWLNIRDFGATGNGVTDDSAAIKSAIDAVNSFKWALNPGMTPVLYCPSGVYFLKSTTLPIFWGGGTVQGEGKFKTIFLVDKTYVGDVFSWSEAWLGGAFYSGSTTWTGSAEEITAGPTARDFSIHGDLSTTNTQVALGVYDRCDSVLFSDIFIGWMQRALYIGAPKIQVQSYNRESHYRNLKIWNCGTTTIPAVEITSTWNGAGDTTNQLCFYDINIFGSKGVSLWLRGNPPATCRLIRFFGLRIENAIGTDGNDMLVIGDPTMTGFVRDIYFWGLELIVGPASFANLRLTANSGPNAPFLIGVHGGMIGGGAVGIAVDYGRALSFELDTLSGTTAGITIGANVAGTIFLNGYGSEEFWTKTVFGTNQQACLRFPSNNINETATTSVDPTSLLDGSGQTITVNCAGVRQKDFALASFDQDLQGVSMTAWAMVDQIKVRFQNETGATVDLPAGTLRAKVIKATT